MVKIVQITSGMFYTLNSVAVQGTGMGGWTSDEGIALGFARERDAKEFISKFLLGEAHRLEVRHAPA